ncbi:transposase [Streptomyces sp. DG2A-72]|uniref:transposase n=1 Tax=Streptomyces sp. DG2A-72 TaxID=3051386 RepID=UPI0034648D1F
MKCGSVIPASRRCWLRWTGRVTRGDLTDAEWRLIEPHLPLGAFEPISDLRSYFNAVMWRFRTGSPWRDVPENYGSWSTIYDRLRMWAREESSRPSWKRWSHAADTQPPSHSVISTPVAPEASGGRPVRAPPGDPNNEPYPGGLTSTGR